MTVTTSSLAAARDDIRQRLRHADAAGHPDRFLLEALYDVADMTCRIGDYGDSAHYQADKSGGLVRGALNVRRQASELYAVPDTTD